MRHDGQPAGGGVYKDGTPGRAPVAQMEGLRNRQFATIGLLLELASVGTLEQVGVRRSGNETDDVEAEDDAVYA